MTNVLNEFASSIILLGAYGRTYPNKKSAVADWTAGKDFKISGGPYCSIRDVDKMLDSAASIYIQTKQGYVEVT